MEAAIKRKHQFKRDTKDLLFVITIVALPLLQFFIFYVLVNFNSILLAFKNYTSDSEFTFVGFDNFRSLFIDFKNLTLFKVAAKNSLLVFGIGCPISIVLALLFSYYIYKSKTHFGSFFKIILFLPSIIPSIALATIFVQVADSAYPKFMSMVFNKEVLGLFQNPSLTIYTIIFYNVWCSFGVNVLLFLNAMSSINPSMVEAAKIDGVGFFRELWSITLPSVYGTIRTLLVVSIGNFFINTASIISFYGTRAEERIYTIGYYLYKETILNASSNAALPKLAALGILLTLVTVPVVYLVKFIMDHFDPNR